MQRHLHFLARPIIYLAAAIVLSSSTVSAAELPDQTLRRTIVDDSDGEFADAVAVDGQLLAVGRPAYDTRRGAVDVYEYIADEWQPRAVLLASDGTLISDFGGALALDGDTLLVGASDMGSSGAAYVFHRQGGVWVEQAKWTIPGGGTALARFGWALAVAGDRAVVGAPGQGLGNAYVYERSGVDWSGPVVLSPNVTWPMGAASTVALAGDRIAMGARRDNENGANAGAVFVFTREPAGSWTQTQKLSGTQAGNQFGAHVRMLGTRMVVSEPYGGPQGVGAVYVYEWSGGAYVLGASLLPGSTHTEQFGQSLALTQDRVVVGAPASFAPALGRAYSFSFVEGAWQPGVELLPDIAEIHGVDFGRAVAATEEWSFVAAIERSSRQGTLSVFGPPGPEFAPGLGVLARLSLLSLIVLVGLGGVRNGWHRHLV